MSTPISQLFSRVSLEKGYTYREFPGGRRLMIHRWDYRKIRGSKPLKQLMVENVARHNSFLKALMRRNP